MSWFIIAMQAGMWFGYVTFGYISDAIGRKRTYVTYLVAAAALIALYTSLHAPLVLLLLGPFVAFFATGYFSGFGAVTAEIYPTEIRATAQGFTYNLGRIASAAAPFTVGTLAQTHGLRRRAVDTSIAFAAGGRDVDLDSGDARAGARVRLATSRSEVSAELGVLRGAEARVRRCTRRGFSPAGVRPR